MAVWCPAADAAVGAVRSGGLWTGFISRFNCTAPAAPGLRVARRPFCRFVDVVIDTVPIFPVNLQHTDGSRCNAADLSQRKDFFRRDPEAARFTFEKRIAITHISA